MAIDHTPPRLKLIITIAAITVITLVALDFVFKSYYGMMTDEAQREKVAPTRDREEANKAEEAAFAKAETPIDKAMGEIAKGARAEIIAPQQSDDLGPMTGWTKLPKPLPAKPTAEAPQVDADAGAAAVGADAATTLAADAGPAPMHTATDAGAAPVHHPAVADGGAH